VSVCRASEMEPTLSQALHLNERRRRERDRIRQGNVVGKCSRTARTRRTWVEEIYYRASPHPLPRNGRRDKAIAESPDATRPCWKTSSGAAELEGVLLHALRLVTSSVGGDGRSAIFFAKPAICAGCLWACQAKSASL